MHLRISQGSWRPSEMVYNVLDFSKIARVKPCVSFTLVIYCTLPRYLSGQEFCERLERAAPMN